MAGVATNTVKFTESGGRIDVIASRVAGDASSGYHRHGSHEDASSRCRDSAAQDFDSPYAARNDFDTTGNRPVVIETRLVLMVQHVELLFALPAEHIMSMPATRHRWTVEEVERLVDARDGLTPRYELVDGELLVTPAPTPRHQRLVFKLALLLERYLTSSGIGEVFLGPCTLNLATGERYEPDLFVIPADNGRRPVLSDSPARPMLVCESLSPGSSRHDRITKRRAFQRNDVPMYWTIDGDAKAFEVWRPRDERPALVDDRLVWHPVDVVEAFDLDVARFFESVEDGAPLA